MMFSLEKSILLIDNSYFSRKQQFEVKHFYMMDFFSKNMPILDYLHYLWIIVMFLSPIWTLILTAPIYCRGSTGEQVM